MSTEEIVAVFFLLVVIAVMLIRPFVVRQTDGGRGERSRQGVRRKRPVSEPVAGRQRRRERHRVVHREVSGA